MGTNVEESSNIVLQGLQHVTLSASCGYEDVAIWYVKQRFHAPRGSLGHQTLLHHFEGFNSQWKRRLWYALVYQSKDSDREEALERLLRGRHGDWLANQLREGLPEGHHPRGCEVCERVYGRVVHIP